MNMKAWIQIAIGVTGYSVWACMAIFDPSIRPTFLTFNIGMAVGTIGLVLRDMNAAPGPSSAVPPSTPEQVTK